MIHPNSLKYGLVHSNDDLNKMILQHPDFPILYFAGEYANSGDYCYTVCTYVGVEIGEYLDCITEAGDDIIFTDREHFRERLSEKLCDTYNQIKFGASNPYIEFKKYIQNKIDEYESFWKPCIIVFVDN